MNNIKMNVIISTISCTMLCCVPFVCADSGNDGKLHLNTDVITSEQTNFGGTREFAWYNQLFLEHITERTMIKEQEELQRFQQIEETNFREIPLTIKTTVVPINNSLFMNYTPYTMVVSDEDQSAGSNRLMTIIVAGILAILMGFLMGNWWSKRRRKMR